jgi:hypothetical protein
LASSVPFKSPFQVQRSFVGQLRVTDCYTTYHKNKTLPSYSINPSITPSPSRPAAWNVLSRVAGSPLLVVIVFLLFRFTVRVTFTEQHIPALWLIHLGVF